MKRIIWQRKKSIRYIAGERSRDGLQRRV